MQARLSVDTLGDLDNGASRLVIDNTINLAVADLDDRGTDGKPRKVVITLQLQQADNGLVVGHVETKLVLPALKTAGTVAEFRRRQNKSTQLVFQQFAPEDPEQTTIDQQIATNVKE
jgi:hypothetical protein